MNPGYVILIESAVVLLVTIAMAALGLLVIRRFGFRSAGAKNLFIAFIFSLAFVFGRLMTFAFQVKLIATGGLVIVFMAVIFYSLETGIIIGVLALCTNAYIFGDYQIIELPLALMTLVIGWLYRSYLDSGKRDASLWQMCSLVFFQYVTVILIVNFAQKMIPTLYGGIAVLSQFIPILLMTFFMTLSLGGFLLFDKQIENEGRRLLKSVEGSEQKIRGIYDLLTGFVGLLSPEGILLEVNKTALLFADVDRKEVLSKFFWETPWWSSSKEMADFIRTAVQTAAKNQLVNSEVVQYAKDGTIMYYDFSLRPILDDSGTVVYLLAEGRDITEAKRAKAELILLNGELERKVAERTEKLEEINTGLQVEIELRSRIEADLMHAKESAEIANRAKSTFLANMSHEIRTPMNAVLGFAQLLNRDDSLSREAQSKVAAIISSGDHLLVIINEILEISRIESGRVEVHTETVDIHQLLNDLSGEFGRQIEEKGITFKRVYEQSAPRYIMSDYGKLRQILTNLLANAVKFTERGAVTLRLASDGTDRIAIEVQDTGIGIGTGEEEIIFRPFERTQRGEAFASGTGLGLAISREFARLIGGDITVESRLGEGSTFRLSFRAPMTSMQPSAQATSGRVVGLSPKQEPLCILVVDDIDINRHLLRELLESVGFNVEEAHDGKEAIRMVEAIKPRVVIMDMVMPIMNGIEATQAIRRSHSSDDIVIIGLSASALENQEHDFIRADVNAFLAKPYLEQDLFDLLAKHVGVDFIIEEQKADLSRRLSEDRTLDLGKMPQAWRDAYVKALSEGSITQVKRLGEEAKSSDPALSAYLLECAGRYDLDLLKRLI